jgi:hypothetical protein
MEELRKGIDDYCEVLAVGESTPQQIREILDKVFKLGFEQQLSKQETEEGWKSFLSTLTGIPVSKLFGREALIDDIATGTLKHYILIPKENNK